MLGKATAADHLCLQMQKVRMVIKCQVAMVIATIAIIVIIATIGIIAMMMYADEVEDGRSRCTVSVQVTSITFPSPSY